MKTVRPYLYGLIGLLFGSLGAFAGIGLLFPDFPSSLALPVLIGGGVVGALALGALGWKLSKMQEHSEKSGGYFSLANRIGVVIVIVGAIGSALVNAIPASMPYVGLIRAPLGSIIVSAIIDFISSVCGVWYVVLRGKLLPKHTPLKTALWVAGLFVVLFSIFLGVSYRYGQDLMSAFAVQWGLSVVVIFLTVYLSAKLFSRSTAAAPVAVAAIPSQPQIVAPVAQQVPQTQFAVPHMQQPIIVQPAARHTLRTILIILGSLILIAAAAAGGYFYYTRYYKPADVPLTREQATQILREQILPSVVNIGCTDTNGGKEDQFGTGIYTVYDSGPVVETNAHVVLAPDGQFHGCNIYFPNPQDGSFYESAYKAGTPMLYHDLQSQVDGKEVDGLDFAVLPITGPVTDQAGKTFPFPIEKPDVLATIRKYCHSKEPFRIGDPIYLAGYPVSGGDTISLTEGVVSGFAGDFDEQIKVSAAINHGNSGGLAIGADTLCYYGIPSAGTFYTGGNLGIVLDGNFINTFLSGLTGRHTYQVPDPQDDEAALNREYRLSDFTIKYPDQWTTDTKQIASDGSQALTFSAPPDNALDGILESVQIITAFSAKQQDLKDLGAQIMAQALQVDPQFKNADVTSETIAPGIVAYSIPFIDPTDPEAPVVHNHFLFLRGDVLYDVHTTFEVGVHQDAYAALINAMLRSVKFTSAKSY